MSFGAGGFYAPYVPLIAVRGRRGPPVIQFEDNVFGFATVKSLLAEEGKGIFIIAPECDEMYEWTKENCRSPEYMRRKTVVHEELFSTDYCLFLFTDEDAILFKLRWL